jgi:hypothetical protein
MPYCWQYSLPSNQQLASKPGQQFGHFLAGFAGRLILRSGFAGRERMSESRPLLEGDGGNLQAVNLNGFPRIGQKLRGTRRHGVQNDKGRLLGEFHQLGRASDRAKIEDSGSARDQHQVGDRVAAIAAASECGAVSITTSSAPPSVAACKPCGKRV